MITALYRSSFDLTTLLLVHMTVKADFYESECHLKWLLTSHQITFQSGHGECLL